MTECLDEGILQGYFDRELSREHMENVTSHLASCLTCAAAARELENEAILLADALAPEFETSVPTERLRRRIDAAVAGLQVVHPSGESRAVGTVNRWFQSVSELFVVTPRRRFAYASLAVVLAFAAVIAVIELKRTQIANLPAVALKNTNSNPPANPISRDTRDVSSKQSDTVPVYKRKPKTMPRLSSPEQTVARVKLLPGERTYLKTIAALDSTIKSGSRPMRPALQAEYERNLAFVDRALAAARTEAKNNPNDPDATEFVFAAYQSKVDLLNTVADARLSNREH